MKSFVILLSICLLGSFFVPSPGTGTVVDTPATCELCALTGAGYDAPASAPTGEVGTGIVTLKVSCNEDNHHHNKYFRFAAARDHVAAACASALFTAVLTAAHTPAPDLSALRRLNI